MEEELVVVQGAETEATGTTPAQEGAGTLPPTAAETLPPTAAETLPPIAEQTQPQEGQNDQAAQQMQTSQVIEGGQEIQEEEGGFPFLVVGIVLAVLVIGAVVAVLLLKKKRSNHYVQDYEHTVEVDSGRTEQFATQPGELFRTQPGEQAGRTIYHPEADEDSAEEPALEQAPVAAPVIEDAPKTEMINQPMSHPRFTIGRKATIGGRDEQQDSFYCSNWTDDAILSQRGLLVAVADGIGGLNDGSLASSTAMAALQSHFARNAFSSQGSNKLLSLAAAAQNEVLRLNQNGHRCGCTLVTVLIEGWDLYLASVGDSRIYLYRAGGLITLNREHTLRRENEDRTEMSREAVSAENLRKPKAITSYIGKSGIRLIDRTIYPMKLLPGDKIALMSDGVFGTLSEEEMIASLRKKPEIAVNEMIASIDARKDPRQDNATVVVVEVQ